MSDGFDITSIKVAAIFEAGALQSDNGLLTLVRSQVARLSQGQVLELRAAPNAFDDLSAWCRLTGNQLLTQIDAGKAARYLIQKGSAGAAHEKPDWGIRMPTRQGRLDLSDWLVGRAGRVPEEAGTYLGFVPRGAVVDPGMPDYPYSINRKNEVWADNVSELYEQAKGQAWNPSTDIPWRELPTLPDDVEWAVCQVMTFLAENEYAALYIPTKFLSRINAQFVEPVLFLATVIQDEARHIEAFTKRALANGGGLQYSAALTERSLHSLLVEEDYLRSSFLLHVLGEGTFLDLLHYVEVYAPDPVTREIVRRARIDEGRHVAYGIAHVKHLLERVPKKADDLIQAVEERNAYLDGGSGGIPMLTEALARLGAQGNGGMEQGMQRIQALYAEMDENRVKRMILAGISRPVAVKISRQHTPNFM